MMPPENHLTLAQFALINNLPIQQVRNAVVTNRLETVKVGWHRYVHVDTKWKPPHQLPSAPDGYIPLKEFVVRCGSCMGTIRSQIFEGKIKTIRITNRTFVHESQIAISMAKSRPKMPDVPDGYITVPDFCKTYGVSQSNVHAMFHRGRLKSILYKGRRLITKASADNFERTRGSSMSNMYWHYEGNTRRDLDDEFLYSSLGVRRDR